MGDRANYVVRRGPRDVDVRYSHFGSSFLLADVFWGPMSTLALVESLPEGDWLDDASGEAAVALCKRKRVCAFYTYQLDAATAETAVRLMAPLWRGWNVRFCTRVSEVAATIGVDTLSRWTRYYRRHGRSTMEYVLSMGRPQRLGTVYATDSDHEDFAFGGVISVESDDERRDHLVDVSTRDALFLGPPLLPLLARLPTIPAASKTLKRLRRVGLEKCSADLFTGEMHALIEPKARRLVLTVPSGLNETVEIAQAHAVGAAWPRWKLAVQAGGLAAHFARCGRPVPRVLRYDEPATPRPPLAKRVEYLRELLFDADDRKAAGAVLIGTNEDAPAGLRQRVPPTLLPRRRREHLWRRALRDARLRG